MPVSQKPRKKKTQVIKLNVLREQKVYKVDKTIKVQPKGRPKRLDFPSTKEGKLEFLKVRKEFVDNNPMVEKRVLRTTTRVKESIHPDLLDLFNDPKRAETILKLQADELSEENRKRIGSVTSSIKLYQAMSLIKSISHGSPKRRKIKGVAGKNVKNSISYIDGLNLLRGMKRENSNPLNALKTAA